MLFINPIEILDLQQLDIVNIDDQLIKKSKKKVYADIDLSDDGNFIYKGQKITKSDCTKAIDELNDNDKKEFYFHLATLNLHLNNFLATGDEKIFSKFKQESIYKLPEFINFISPYFSYYFDRSLLKSFKNNNVELFNAILRLQNLISPSDINTAFKSLTIEIQNRIAEVDNIRQAIKDEESEFTETTVNEVLDIVEKRFPIEIINGLPPYFQSQINKIASSINYLQLAIYDSFYDTQTSLDLLAFLLLLNIESAGKPTFEKNYEIVKKKNDERVEQERNAPFLKPWVKVLISVKDIVKKVEAKSMLPSIALNQITELFKVSDLNNLPSFGNEVKNQIGYSLRSLAISSWNEKNDMKSALALIKVALEINVSDEVKVKFKQDQKELEELEIKYKGVFTCYFCGKNPTDKDSKISTIIYKETYRSSFPKRVQYSYVGVEIPRCKYCKEVHSKNQEEILWLVSTLSVTVGAVLAGITIGNFILGGALGLIVGLIGGNLIKGSSQNKICKKAGTINANDFDVLRKHPIVEERMKLGWTFNKPTP